MLSKRRHILSAVMLFYLFLRRHSCLAQYIVPPRTPTAPWRRERKMVSKRRQIFAAAILFYLFLWRQWCLALYIETSRHPTRSWRRKRMVVSKRRQFLSTAILFSYSYGSHVLPFGTTLGYPQALHLVPSLTTAAYRRHFLLPILTAALPPRIPYLSAILFYLFLRWEPCLAL